MAKMFVSRKVSVVLLSAAAGLSCALLCVPASQAATAKKQSCNAKNHSQNSLSCYCSTQLGNDSRNGTHFTGARDEVACSGRGGIFSLIIPVSSPVVTAPPASGGTDPPASGGTDPNHCLPHHDRGDEGHDGDHEHHEHHEHKDGNDRGEHGSWGGHDSPG